MHLQVFLLYQKQNIVKHFQNKKSDSFSMLAQVVSPSWMLGWLVLPTTYCGMRQKEDEERFEKMKRRREEEEEKEGSLGFWCTQPNLTQGRDGGDNIQE